MKHKTPFFVLVLIPVPVAVASEQPQTMCCAAHRLLPGENEKYDFFSYEHYVCGQRSRIEYKALKLRVVAGATQIVEKKGHVRSTVCYQGFDNRAKKPTEEPELIFRELNEYVRERFPVDYRHLNPRPRLD